MRLFIYFSYIYIYIYIKYQNAYSKSLSHAIMSDLYFFPLVFFKALFTEHCFIGKRDKNNCFKKPL